MNRVFFCLVVVSVAMGGIGCSTLEPLPPEEIIAQRAQSQARHLIDRDYDLALTYVVPSYQSSARASYYEAEFAGSASWLDASVRWVKCDEVPEPDRCEVRVWVYGSQPSLSGTSSRGDDVPWSWNTVWIKMDGAWYQYLD